nr:xylulose kinase-1 [Tanacetum cinerariifolium]
MDNIVYKRDQLAQNVHMLTKPKFFYDHTTKQALGFQNPFYPKKAQQLEPKLYDGNVIKNTYAIVIPDYEETLMLAEESRLKMFLKQQDPMVLEKKVDTTPVDYVVLNQLSQDFEKQFVPQTELSDEQDFWSQNTMNSLDLSPSKRPTKVEVSKELPKVNMVNTSLKKLNTILLALTWLSKKEPLTQLSLRARGVLNENEQLLEQVINKDIMNIVVNFSMDSAFVNVHECKKCLKLETELLNKKDYIEKETYDKLFRSYTTLEKHCISLEVDTQLNQEIFQRDNSVSNQSAPTFDQYFELNELKAQSQEKDMVIRKLKERIKSLSGNMNKDKVKKDVEEIETINIKLDHRVSKLIAENKHLKQIYKQLYKSIKPTQTTIGSRLMLLGKVDTAAEVTEEITLSKVDTAAENGNGPVSVTTDTNRMIKVLPPKTAKEIVAREMERKARTTLLVAVPEDHLEKFHKMADVKEMWEAIKSSFSFKEMLGAMETKLKTMDDSKALVTIDRKDIDWSGHVEEDAQNYDMMAYSSSNLGSDNEESDLENTSANDRYVVGMHVVPPPMTGKYMPFGPDVEIDYSKFTYGPKQTSTD